MTATTLSSRLDDVFVGFFQFTHQTKLWVTRPNRLLTQYHSGAFPGSKPASSGCSVMETMLSSHALVEVRECSH